ncbi:response regulator [Pseudoxanthomonas sacheonensis]|uniref:DNA-binding NtrC family response regulator n=1 Tax=Pseudoxanthomonas sacheonensis TaxID=443615 RepID=A0ABU1RQU3_9GAMM|nr:response regulator [Pseudoxanthomonas sacheonensis]MDR6841151.1 DNA-binding NtrC family response regulator [Pseudoxanthomonas sacheonensis]
MASILFIEDEEDLRGLIADSLSDEGHHVVVAAEGTEAIRLLASGSYDVVISDVSMPGEVSGLDLAELIEARYPQTRMVLVSGHARAQLPSIPAGIQFLPKPYRLSQLLALLPDPCKAG